MVDIQSATARKEEEEEEEMTGRKYNVLINTSGLLPS